MEIKFKIMNKKSKKIEEAEEAGIYYEDEEGKTSSEGSGDDLEENLEEDYKIIPELDKYEDEGLDNEDYSEINEEERRKVEEELGIRDQKNKLMTGRIPAALLREYEEDSDEEQMRKNMKEKRMRFIDADQEAQVADADKFIDHEDIKGKKDDWLGEVHTQKYIYKQFINFIRNYKEEDKSIYEERIINMCSNNKQSLEVNYSHLARFNQNIANWLIEYPQKLIPRFNEGALNLTLELAPQYSEIHSEIHVRIRDLPVQDNIRDLRYSHLGNLLQVVGVVTKRSGVFPQMKKINFFCEKCGEKKGPLYYNGIDEVQLGSCNVCGSKGPFKVNVEDTIYRNYQKITIQEAPGTVPPGRIPRYKEVILTNDLVDSIRPGDDVEVVAQYTFRFDISNNIKHSFPIFNTFLEANYIKRMNELEVNELTDDDKVDIRKFSMNKNIASIIFNSIAPSIYGHEFIKRALAVAMFGGCPKDVNEKHKIRGDINVLILGDPGLAKSQFLKYIQKVFHRSVYTTGKGASAVGLTAGVHKDPVTREWVLEGGALVLADKGICLIDEFDKMNDQDRTSIHEAMEQQSISISKAGIVTSLLARCSVIAAANPIRGRYNERENFSDNVDLTEPILSRFDILCVVKDHIDEKVDHSLSTFVINSHLMSHPDKDSNDQNLLLKDKVKEEKDKESISQEMLRKYIMYARKYIHPKLSDINQKKIANFYAELRKESDSVGGIPIAVRHFESIIRMSEAHAKMHLRDYIRTDDIDFGIKMLLESFLMSQKYSISKTLRSKFKYYINAKSDTVELLLNILNRIVTEHANYYKLLKKSDREPEIIEIKQDTFEKEAQEVGAYNFDDFYNSQAFKKYNRLEQRKIYHNKNGF